MSYRPIYFFSAKMSAIKINRLAYIMAQVLSQIFSVVARKIRFAYKQKYVFAFIKWPKYQFLVYAKNKKKTV